MELDPVTRGPVLDDAFMTSVPGIFASGNVSIVFDLVDYVSESGELAARGANDSMQHIDFMIGTQGTNVDGIQEDGTVVPVFRDGNWVI